MERILAGWESRMPQHRADSSTYTRAGSPQRGRRIVVSVIVMLVVVALVAGACLWVRYARRGQAGGIGATPAVNLPSSSPTFTSSVDANGNGMDYYTDIVHGARKDAEAMPT